MSWSTPSPRPMAAPWPMPSPADRLSPAARWAVGLLDQLALLATFLWPFGATLLLTGDGDDAIQIAGILGSILAPVVLGFVEAIGIVHGGRSIGAWIAGCRHRLAVGDGMSDALEYLLEFWSNSVFAVLAWPIDRMLGNQDAPAPEDGGGVYRYPPARRFPARLVRLIGALAVVACPLPLVVVIVT